MGYPFYGFYFDKTYILILIGAAITLYASAKMKSTFRRYSQVQSHSGITGAQAAQTILQNAGIYDVTVEPVEGELTDHYDPRSKVLRLSSSTYNKTSIAAVGIAAHECGHSIQHQQNYMPLKLRAALVPVANLGSTMAWPLIILGIILSMNQTLITVGIFLFSFAVIFQIVTLPVEFNASNRALRILSDSNMLYPEEVAGTKKVLKAAAMTYVASAAAAILSLLRLVLLFGNRD